MTETQSTKRPLGAPGEHDVPPERPLSEGALEEHAPEVDTPPEDERVRITPTLVILGILAVALGVFSALVMSAQSLAR